MAEEKKTVATEEAVPPVAKKPTTRRKAATATAEAKSKSTAESTEAKATSAAKSSAKKATASAASKKTAEGAAKTATGRSTSAKKATEPAAVQTDTGDAPGAAKPSSTTVRKSATGTGTRKKSTQTGAKKPAEAGEPPAEDKTAQHEPVTDAAKDAAPKRTTRTRKPTAKSATADAAADPAADTSGATATPPEEPASPDVSKEAAQEEPSFPRITNLPAPTPTKDITRSRGRDVSDARPPLEFPEAMKRNFFSRVLLILVVAAVLVVSVFIYVSRPGLYTEQTNSVSFLYLPAGDQTLVAVNGTECARLSGAYSASSENGRGDVCAAVIGGNLYLIRGKDVLLLAESVVDFTLAAEGDAVAYRTAPSNLYYRKTARDGEAALISRECYTAAYCLSPNAKELVYTAGAEAESAALRVESYSGSRPYMENVIGLTPIAVSNSCDYIYYTDRSGALFVFDSQNAAKVKCGTAPVLDSLVFNRDFTELLFSENGGTVFFADGGHQQIIGAASTEHLQLLPNRRVAGRKLANGVQYMQKSFYKNYFLHEVGTGKQLTYLDRKGNLQSVSFVDSAESITVTDKGVFFLLTSKSGEDAHCFLYFAKPGKTETSRIDWGVSTYCTNIDGSRVMYTGYENALYLYRPETGSRRFCDSIVPSSLSVTANDQFCFWRTDGELCISDNGGELRLLSEGTVAFFVDAHALYYCTDLKEDGTFTVSVNYRGSRLSEVVAEGVSKIE